MSDELPDDDQQVLALMEELLQLEAEGLVTLPATYSTVAVIEEVRQRYGHDPDVLRVCQLADDLLAVVKVLHEQVQAQASATPADAEPGLKH